jgi:sterol desaturase/sphingolipid hydroxylase (fatty acid hydroxylase superfamily)
LLPILNAPLAALQEFEIVHLTGTGVMVLNWFVKPEEVLMLQTASPLILKLSLFLMTAVATHLVMSFGQTFLHYKVAHHPIGGKLFRNHINFHHTHYADDHLVSRTYLGDEGNITPYFFIPLFLVGGCAYFLLPLNLFVVTLIASAASFYAHVFFDKEYHVEESRLQRFAWFRRQQELHFVHHRHANSNFGVIHFFWDKILGTYRMPNAGA